MPLFAATLALLALVAWSSCTKTTPFGNDLLEDQLADYSFTDTLSMRCTVLQDDTAVVTMDASTAEYLLCGELNDPIFGKAKADVYTLFQLSVFNPDFDPATTKYDSVVMYLRYDVDGVYGDTLQPQTLRVHRLTETLNVSDDVTYKSNQKLAYDPTPIGEVANFLPRPTDRDSLFSVTTRAPYLRIRLSDAFGQELYGMDSLSLTQDSLFWAKIKGLHIETSASTNPGAMLAFDLDNEEYSRIRLYYHKDTVPKVFDYFFNGSRKFVNFQHDYSNTPAGQAINQDASQTGYIQGMTGVRMKVEFPHASKLENIAVNAAELVFSTAVDPGANANFLPAEQIFATYDNTDSTEVFVPDVIYALGTGVQTDFSRFGGAPVKKTLNGVDYYEYRMNLSEHFQDIVDDKTGLERNRAIYLTVYPNIRSVMRSVINGPQNPTRPMKLELKYTRIKG
ncbi:MAG: DUF4270 family protein [Saprospiraceae bacterium]|nr:DUF4270 family protein [Saprospiraceae bacterium]